MEFEKAKSDLIGLLVVVASTAILLWFGNGLNPWWPLMWLAPFPALWYSLHTSLKLAACASLLGWLIGSANILPTFLAEGAPFWAWFADFAGIALVFTAGTLLFRKLVLQGAVWSGMLALPSLWVSVDWLRNWTTPHGTAADLAYTQLRFLPFLQLASLTGPWGMTFLLLWIPAAAATYFFLRSRQPRRARRVGLLVSATLLAVLAFGTLQMLTTGQRNHITVGLIASDSEGSDDVAKVGADAHRLLTAYGEEAKRLAQRGAQVIVMPEKIAVVRDVDVLAGGEMFQQIADSAQVAIVVGEVYLSRAENRTLKYNRANLYRPYLTAASYDKQHLLPPFESSLTPGTKELSFLWQENILGVSICKDMDFTSTSQRYAQQSVGLMLVPAWDFNLDRVWHGHMAIMRGVEGGFSVVRAAKDGNLTVSDNRGRLLAVAQSNSSKFATLVTQVPVGHGWTLFQSWGDWFAWFAVGLLLFVSIKRALLSFSAKSTQAGS